MIETVENWYNNVSCQQNSISKWRDCWTCTVTQHTLYNPLPIFSNIKDKFECFILWIRVSGFNFLPRPMGLTVEISSQPILISHYSQTYKTKQSLFASCPIPLSTALITLAIPNVEINYSMFGCERMEIEIYIKPLSIFFFFLNAWVITSIHINFFVNFNIRAYFFDFTNSFFKMSHIRLFKLIKSSSILFVFLNV